MRKYSSWILVGFLTFPLGVLVFYLFWFPSRAQNVSLWEVPPIETFECADSKGFPGKSISVNKLDSGSPSIFDDKEFASDATDRFYSALQEERFEAKKFDDETGYPEIAKADEIYRSFWIRTFHNPYMFRIYRTHNDKFLVIKKTDGKGGYDPGLLVVNKTRKLNDQEWCNFIHLLNEAGFWNKKKINISHLADELLCVLDY